jgi:trigger factor
VVDEEVEAAIEQARKQQAHPEPAGDDGLAEDGMALCKVELLFEDAVVFERDGLRLSPATPLPGVEPNAFKQAMLGTKDGSVVELPLTFPADFEHEPARNREGQARVTVTQAFRLVVPSREELMKIVGVESEDALKQTARERMDQANVEQERARVETELLERLIAAHPMQLPANMVEEQAKARMAQMRAELVQRGASEAQADEEVSRREGEASAAAEKSSRGYFLIERIAEKEGLRVTENDLMSELKSIARRNKASLEEVRDYYKEQNLFPQLGMEILERKVRTFLRENASIQTPNV